MAEAGPRPAPPPALVVLGVIAGDPELAREAAARFAEPHGGLGRWGPAVAFDHTDYYQAELGEGLTRTFVACRSPLPPERLPELKAQSWALEQELARDGRRRVNLDPGLLDHTKVVLASFKPGPQKLYLGSGVWADTVLYLADGAYGPLPWTFSDLRQGPHLAYFQQAREDYKALLRRGRG